MDTPSTAADHVTWVPVDSCTLPTEEQPLRVAEFDDLFAGFLRDVEYSSGSPARARLVLAGDGSLPGRVQRLVDAESSCCSFFAFTLTPLDVHRAHGETVLALDISVPAARSGVLAGLVRRADAARPAAS